MAGGLVKPPAAWPAVQPLGGAVGQLSGLRLDPVADQAASWRWNGLIYRWQYLGYIPLPGALLRYLTRLRQFEPIFQVTHCLDFTAVAMVGTTQRLVYQQFPLARRVVGQGEHAAAARRGRHSSPSPTRGDAETVG